MSDARTAGAIASLRAVRPRNRAVRRSLFVLAALVVYAWVWGAMSGEIAIGDMFSARRARNLDRFLGEMRPYPLQGEPWDWGVFLAWARGLMGGGGLDALLKTVHISVVAICLAALVGGLLALPAARNVARPDPWAATLRDAPLWRRAAWGGVVLVTRAFFAVVRGVPEYVWAFLLVRMLGTTAWPAVLALAIHNAGIVGRLQSEVVENVPRAAPEALRALGAGRAQVALFVLLPATLGRFLLFFFYRWETCVREATVLGLLGMASLGAMIREARVGQRTDEVVFYALLGAVLVLLGDVVSLVARSAVRRAR